MSAFAGFIAFGGGKLPPGTDSRLGLALSGTGLGRPIVRLAEGAAFVFRQRILSPEDRWERQPSTGNGIVSLFDGRLDNRAELLAALGLAHHERQPVPDGDLVRLAYERWEEEAVKHLLGDFAWAVWNGRAKRLMLARDHSFQRSLYYARGDGFIAFATGYSPLLALPQVSREVDELTVAEALLTAPVDSERTYYKGIAWVGAATRVVATAEGLRRDRFWEPEPRPLLRLGDDREYAEAARSLFDKAVACRLRLAGPAVSTVSGGLDSSAVAATAARLLGQRKLPAVCIVPPDGFALPASSTSYNSERPYVEALAAGHPNLQVSYVTSTDAEVFETGPAAFFSQFGAPMWSPNNGGWFLTAYRWAAAQGAGTLLLGIMGNITFSSDSYERLTALRQDGHWFQFARELWAIGSQGTPAARNLVRGCLLSMLSPALQARLRHWRRRGLAPWQQVPAPLNPEFVRHAGIEDHYQRHGVALFDRWAPDARIKDLRFMLLCSRMAMEARSAMREVSGVTGSDPFSDRRIVDFCLSLPADQFMRHGQGRRLARTVFADRLPPAILNNQLRGVQNVDWFQRLSPLREAVAADLERLQRSPLASRILDLPRLKRSFELWPADAEEAFRTNWLTSHGLFRAMHVGRFLHWVEGSND